MKVNLVLILLCFIIPIICIVNLVLPLLNVTIDYKLYNRAVAVANFSNCLPIAEKMIESFEILNKSG